MLKHGTRVLDHLIYSTSRAGTTFANIRLRFCPDITEPHGDGIINQMYPPKTECGCMHGEVFENVRARNPLTLCGVDLYLYLYMYRCGCTDRVTLRVFS